MPLASPRCVPRLPNMKTIAASIACAWLLGLGARAQVTVEVALEQDSYLPQEQCMAEIRITNFSGRTLRFGPGSEWFDLTVESYDGYFVERLAVVPPAEPLDIPNASRGIRRVDLAPAFDLSKPGRYFVIASVQVAELNREITSARDAFNIMSGVRLWDQSFGVPGGDPGKPPEVRHYTLLQTNDRKRLALYVRVSKEQEARVIRVFPLGRLLSFSKPEAQVDRLAKLHVLFQTGAKQYTYCVVAYDGTLAVRQTYQISDTHPGLRLVEGGEIKVVGGFRLKSSYDIPPPADDDAPQPASAEPPESTQPKPVVTVPAEPAKP